MSNILKNWKTTSAGVLTAGIGVAALFGVSVAGAQPIAPDVALGMVTAGLGLIFGKDFNISGK